jgi:uridine kinase
MPVPTTRIARLIVTIQELRRSSAARTVVVALDGRSGAGKSTLAAAIAARAGAVVIDGDDFYTGPAVEQLANAADRADQCIDWRRQGEVLSALADGRTACWHAYDWDVNDGRRQTRPTVCHAPNAVVILEGTFTARPELGSLIDLRVLLRVAADTQRDQFCLRDGRDTWTGWSQTWMAAEDHYFQSVMTPADFDVVVDG